MYCWLWRFDNWYFVDSGDVNGAGFDNCFPVKYM